MCLALFLVAVTVFSFHAAMLGDWLIDDSGITFAYARNLAQGHGLVAQPGVEPVEGFSNPTWTLLLSALFVARAFFVPWSVKLLSAALVVASLALITILLEKRHASPMIVALPALLLSLNTSFVVWTMSGLENPLLALLVVTSAWLAMSAREAHAPRRHDLAAGVVAGLLALTRPDGALYALAYPLVLSLAGSRGVRALLPRLARYGAACGALAGGYELFRWLYFGDLVPNTFHAKVQSFLLSFGLDRIVEVAVSAAGRTTLIVLAAMGVAGLIVARRGRPSPRATTLVLYLTLSTAIYWLMPPDWMGEYRFATAFFILFYWVLAESLATLSRSLGEHRTVVRWGMLAVVLLVLTENVHVHAARSSQFARQPTVPFARVAELARAYDALAARTSVEAPSLLAPDLGGTLFEARRLRVYDLAGLCDRTIARTLMADRVAFHDYVFDVARPTFVHIHGSWAAWAALHDDPRFERDYLPLHERWSAPPRTRRPSTREPWSGDYVRTDAIKGQADLVRLRNAYADLGLDRALP